MIADRWQKTFSVVTPALIQDTYKFKEYKSRGLLNAGETPALSVLYQLIFFNQGRGDNGKVTACQACLTVNGQHKKKTASLESDAVVLQELQLLLTE
ncbi:MAG: hypothetical protein BGO52_16095 [Sphingobacteriales bacterium 44-61]|nr:MAG: hypothetical protein BGO52_16095 [Sphingobacteriales bacterium 44-61]